MAKIAIRNYTFNKATKQVTFTDYANIRLDEILLITNVTSNVIIYNFADNTKGGTVSSNVLTLTYDTTSMNNSDKLLIYYDDPTVSTDFATQTTLAQIKTDVDKIPSSPATEGGNLASIKTNTDKIPALGQALASASVPVILPTATITTLTPPAAITNFANETGGNLAAIKTDVDKIPSQGQALAAASTPVVLPVAQISTLTPPSNTGYALDASLTTTNTEIGIVTETAPASDTASSGLNGRLQRIAQRITSLIAAIATLGGYTSASTAPGAAQQLPLAQYNSAAPTIVNANFTQLQADVNANLKTTEGTLLAGENLTTNRMMVQQTNSYAHISTSTTTTVKSGAGFLHAVSVNTLGTVASTTTIYDNTTGSGTVIGVINTLTLSGIFVLDVSFATGLTLVTTGTAAPDLTVSYL